MLAHVWTPRSNRTVNECRTKRRWYQFSLRTLLAFTALCAVVSGWIGKRLDETSCEQTVVGEIESLGGWVEYHGNERGPSWMVRRFRRVWWVELSGTYVSNAGLEGLKQMTKLKTLRLDDTQITDQGLKHLTALASLEELGLFGSQVTDAGLVQLKKLTNLKMLCLGRTQVTDAGVLHLRRLTDLEGLWLGQTQITDAGLVHLRELTNLEKLDLSGTEVTDDGVERLQRALPDCVIHH